MRDVAIVLAVFESISDSTKVTSRQKIRCGYRGVTSLIMTPRLRAESDGVIVTLEGMRRTASETLESCLGRPISNNTVLD